MGIARKARSQAFDLSSRAGQQHDGLHFARILGARKVGPYCSRVRFRSSVSQVESGELIVEHGETRVRQLERTSGMPMSQGS